MANTLEANMTYSGLRSIESAGYSFLYIANALKPFCTVDRAAEKETDDCRFNMVEGEGLYYLSYTINDKGEKTTTKIRY